LKIHASLLVVSTLLAGSPAVARALHSGGVGECEACHSMHNSFEGAPSVTGRGIGAGSAAYLLKGGDASSVCLHCHEAAGMPVPRVHFVSTSTVDLGAGKAPKQLSPGGDFGWLKKTYTWTPAPGAAPLTSVGDRHGHNVVASEYGDLADGRSAAAPGGTYPSANLSCTSCHDPHGRFRRFSGGTVDSTGLPIMGTGSYADSDDPVAGQFAVGVYRLLGGVGYRPPWLPGGFAFTSPPPDAVAPVVYNRTEATTQTRVAYGRGMSEWCANCHPGMLQAGITAGMNGMRHPAGNDARLPNAFQTNYNAYVRTGVISNADVTRSYLSLVPFEEGTGNYAVLKSHARSDDTYLNGPDSQSTTSCITCHRAHASGFDSILRFRAGNAFITVGDGAGNPVWPDPQVAPAEAQGRTAAETQQSYYGRPAIKFAAFQAPLCNKCHVKD
jgi:cytochrome c553